MHIIIEYLWNGLWDRYKKSIYGPMQNKSVWLKIRTVNSCYEKISQEEFNYTLNKGFCYAWKCSLMTLYRVGLVTAQAG
jgi:hypothetical protein